MLLGVSPLGVVPLDQPPATGGGVALAYYSRLRGPAMGTDLRQSTVQTITFGPVLQPDGTPYTAGGFAVQVGAAGVLAPRHSATAIAHVADGNYSVELDATDTAAVVPDLRVELPGVANSYLATWSDHAVLAPAVYDVKYGTAAPLTSGTGANQISPSGGKVPTLGAIVTSPPPPPPPPGSPPTAVNQDTGGTGNLAFVGPSAAGVSVVRAYRASDWQAGRRGGGYVVGQAFVNPDGTWQEAMLLPPGQGYVLLYTQAGTAAAATRTLSL